MSDQRVAAELASAAEKIRDLSGDVADCLAGGMPHDTLTYRGSLLHELCQAALTMCKGYRAKPSAAESSDAPAAVCEGKELPDAPGSWTNGSRTVRCAWLYEVEGPPWLAFPLKGNMVPVSMLPRGHWLKADALPAPAGELERLRAELAGMKQDQDHYRQLVAMMNRMEADLGKHWSRMSGCRHLNLLVSVEALVATIASLEREIEEQRGHDAHDLCWSDYK